MCVSFVWSAHLCQLLSPLLDLCNQPTKLCTHGIAFVWRRVGHNLLCRGGTSGCSPPLPSPPLLHSTPSLPAVGPCLRWGPVCCGSTLVEMEVSLAHLGLHTAWACLSVLGEDGQRYCVYPAPQEVVVQVAAGHPLGYISPVERAAVVVLPPLRSAQVCVCGGGVCVCALGTWHPAVHLWLSGN